MVPTVHQMPWTGACWGEGSDLEGGFREGGQTLSPLPASRVPSSVSLLHAGPGLVWCPEATVLGCGGQRPSREPPSGELQAADPGASLTHLAKVPRQVPVRGSCTASLWAGRSSPGSGRGCPKEVTTEGAGDSRRRWASLGPGVLIHPSCVSPAPHLLAHQRLAVGSQGERQEYGHHPVITTDRKSVV